MVGNLTTETRNKDTMNLDKLDTFSLVKAINTEDKKVALAIEKELSVIAGAVDAMAKRYESGGRIIYCGAGTSGRLGVLDAIELTPTYNVSSEVAFGLMAGGKDAMYRAVEGAEDSKEEGLSDIKGVNLKKEDIVIGLAASGKTPYTIAILEYAKKIGALSIFIVCNRLGEGEKIGEFNIELEVGPEVVTGSTRMKAGSAQKMVLNMLSTATMVKSGKVYENLMINVQATNKKLVERSINILSEITRLEYKQSKDLYEKSNRDIPVALVIHMTEVSKEVAKKFLELSGGNINKAVEKIKEGE